MPKVTSRWPKTPPPDDAPKPKSPDSAIKAGAKKVASKALDATGPGVQVGTSAAGTGTIALATGAAAASATKENRGEQRSQMANELAVHLITHNCALAQGIVSELYSYEKMLWMLDQDSDTLTPLLMNKLAST
jgi:hypothetical protein